MKLSAKNSAFKCRVTRELTLLGITTRRKCD